MIALIYFTRVRVEELCQIKLTNIEINERSGWIYIYGKDHKQRKIDLNKSIRKILSQYLHRYHENLGSYLFGFRYQKRPTGRLT